MIKLWWSRNKLLNIYQKNELRKLKEFCKRKLRKSLRRKRAEAKEDYHMKKRVVRKNIICRVLQKLLKKITKEIKKKLFQKNSAYILMNFSVKMFIRKERVFKWKKKRAMLEFLRRNFKVKMCKQCKKHATMKIFPVEILNKWQGDNSFKGFYRISGYLNMSCTPLDCPIL